MDSVVSLFYDFCDEKFVDKRAKFGDNIKSKLQGVNKLLRDVLHLPISFPFSYFLYLFSFS